MRRQDLLKMVWKNVWRNKMRTMLTVVAVAIGCSSIILMMSIAIGLKNNAEEEIKQQGSLLQVTIHGKVDKSNGQFGNLSKKDYQALKAVPNVQAVLTTRTIQQNPKVKMGAYAAESQIIGINVEEHQKVHQKLERGTYFKDARQGVVVSYGFLRNIYFERDLNKIRASEGQMKGDTSKQQPKKQKVDPLNRTLLLTFEKKTVEGGTLSKTIRVRVDGILEKPANRWMGQESIIYLPQDVVDDVIKWTGNPSGAPQIDINMPKEFLEQEMARDFDSITLQVDKLDNVEPVLKELEEKKYAFYSITQSLKEMKIVFLIIQIGLGGVGAIALAVASIGIVNTMVMSIMERTREIGIMKVIGANVPTVRKMFLLESGYIGLFGGFAGVTFSLTISFLINLAVKTIFSGINNGPNIVNISVIPFWLALFGISFSFLVGILAGLYPANRAVKLTALDAIRQD